MSRLSEWFRRNRSTIGYALGAFNVYNGINWVMAGDNLTGSLLIMVGLFIILDAKE